MKIIFLSLILCVIKMFRFGIKIKNTINNFIILLNISNISKKDPDQDPDPVGSGLFWVSRIRIRILKTGSADPDPKKMDRIRDTVQLYRRCPNCKEGLKVGYTHLN